MIQAPAGTLVAEDLSIVAEGVRHVYGNGTVALDGVDLAAAAGALEDAIRAGDGDGAEARDRLAAFEKQLRRVIAALSGLEAPEGGGRAAGGPGNVGVAGRVPGSPGAGGATGGAGGADDAARRGADAGGRMPAIESLAGELQRLLAEGNARSARVLEEIGRLLEGRGPEGFELLAEQIGDYEFEAAARTLAAMLPALKGEAGEENDG